MTRHDPEFSAWIDRAREVSIVEAADRVGFTANAGEGRKVERHGGCPVCGNGGKRAPDRFWINTAKDLWCCRKCGRSSIGGISLVMFARHVDFLEACEVLAGPRPNPPAGEDAAARETREAAWRAEVEKRRADDAEKAAAATRADNAFREAERARAYGWWRQGQPIAGSPIEAYLRGRGLTIPDGIRLRWHPSWTLYDGEGDDGRARPVHRGPAMFAPIVEGEGEARRFLGLHVTWIDPARPGEKVFVEIDGERVPAKKIRGVKAGGHIVLVEPPGVMRRLFTGEGIETVLSVWTALAAKGSRLLDGAGFRTSVDLGNLAGRAVDRVFHPTERTTDARGHTRRVKVPGIVPDLTSRAAAVPDCVDDLFLLGDGDSERFRTTCDIARAARRHQRDGRTVRPVMAPPGADFNTMIRGLAHV